MSELTKRVLICTFTEATLAEHNIHKKLKLIANADSYVFNHLHPFKIPRGIVEGLMAGCESSWKDYSELLERFINEQKPETAKNS